MGSIERVREDFVDLADLVVDCTGYLDNTGGAAEELILLSDRALRRLGRAALSDDLRRHVDGLLPEFKSQAGIAYHGGSAADGVMLALHNKLSLLAEESNPEGLVGEALKVAGEMQQYTHAVHYKAENATHYLARTSGFVPPGEGILTQVRQPMVEVMGDAAKCTQLAPVLIGAFDNYLLSLNLAATGITFDNPSNLKS